MDSIFEQLQGAAPFSGLGEEALRSLLPGLAPREVVFRPGQVFARRSEKAEQMGIVRNGVMLALHRTFSGNDYIEREYRTGELIGVYGFFSGPGTWPLTISAGGESRVLVFSMRQFSPDGTADDRTKYLVCRSLLQELTNLQNRAIICDISRSAGSVQEKLLTFLDLMQDKFGGDKFRLRVGRDELAELLDVGRSSLYKELGKLKESGVAVVDRNGNVKLDNEKMAQLRAASQRE
jgi:CRP-like cAMP-binding protein